MKMEQGMTRKKAPLPERIHSTGSFLLSNPQSSVNASDAIFDDVHGEKCHIDERFLEAFPDIRFGNDLMAFAMAEHKKFSRFAAAAIKIDPFSKNHASKDKQTDSHACIEAATAIDKACSHKNGIWGNLDASHFGCFFPEMDSRSALETAEWIQNSIRIKDSLTVSIGIAVYPQINFDCHRIMDNACKALDHAAFFGPSSIVVFDDVSLNISADRLYQKGDILSAIKEFKNALQLSPSNINVHNSLGVCYGVLGKTSRALEAFETAMWLDPDEVMPVYNAGYIHLVRGDVNAAIDFFYKADNIQKGLFEISFQLGSIFLERSHFTKAKPLLEAAVQSRSESGPANRNLGLCYKKLDMTKEAIGCYKKAVKINPNDAESLSALGILYDARDENPEIASILCRQSVEISPRNGLYRQRMGRVLYSAGEIESAIRQFEKAEQYGWDCSKYAQMIEKQARAS